MDVKDVLEEQSIVYKEQGSNYVIHCLNPSHEDNNPSLLVDRHDGRMNCFSCSFSGSIFRYFKYDIDILDINIKRLKDKILKIQQESVEMDIPLGAEYIHNEFRGISAKTMEEYKAFKIDKPKELEGRILWPIYDISDKIKYFHGRLEHSKVGAKYINYPTGIEKFLYPQTTTSDHIILVEGFIDMLRLRDRGMNAVCAFGSSLTTKTDIGNQGLIKKFSNFKLQGVNKVYILFDNDKAGIEGAKKIKKGLDNNYIVEILELPKDINDPAELSNKQIENIKKRVK